HGPVIPTLVAREAFGVVVADADARAAPTLAAAVALGVDGRQVFGQAGDRNANIDAFGKIVVGSFSLADQAWQALGVGVAIPFALGAALPVQILAEIFAAHQARGAVVAPAIDVLLVLVFHQVRAVRSHAGVQIIVREPVVRPAVVVTNQARHAFVVGVAIALQRIAAAHPRAKVRELGVTRIGALEAKTAIAPAVDVRFVAAELAVEAMIGAAHARADAVVVVRPAIEAALGAGGALGVVAARTLASSAGLGRAALEPLAFTAHQRGRRELDHDVRVTFERAKRSAMIRPGHHQRALGEQGRSGQRRGTLVTELVLGPTWQAYFGLSGVERLKLRVPVQSLQPELLPL